jgi:outer membrane receptor protein involved in Fe transport
MADSNHPTAWRSTASPLMIALIAGVLVLLATDRLHAQVPEDEGGAPVPAIAGDESVDGEEEEAEPEEGENNAEDPSAQTLPKITVTGSRISRTDIEGPAPVIIIDREQMDRSGFVTVFDALESLSINTGFKFEGPESISGFTPDVQTVNLRGLGVGNTLVLINGRRQANYPAAYQSDTSVFNFASIPLVSVERIEVLTTGASAIYGSDAVAGVINIILRDDINKTAFNVLGGSPTGTKDLKTDWRLQLMNGRSWGDFNYSLLLEYRKRDGVRGSDYDRFDDQRLDYPPNGIGAPGFYDNSLLTLDGFRFALGYPETYRDPQVITGLSGDAACQAAHPRLVLGDRPMLGRSCGDPTGGVAAINFRNANEGFSVTLNSNWEPRPQLSLFADLLYNRSESESYRHYLIFSEQILDFTRPDSVGFGFFDWYLAQRLFTADELGLDSLSTVYDDESWTLTLGARGEIFDNSDWEFTLTHSQYDFESRRPWFRYRELIDKVLGAAQGNSFFGGTWWSGGTIGDLPPDAFPLGDPATLYGPVNDALRSVVGQQSYGNETRRSMAQFVLRGDLLDLPWGPVGYAAVLEYEREKLRFQPDDLLLQRPPQTDAVGDPVLGLLGSGWYGLTGYTGSGDRKRGAVAGELRVPLGEHLVLNLAGRVDEYDSNSTSFGSGFTPNVSLEWRPFRPVLLRAGYAESFRAPDLVQVFTGSGFFTQATDLVRCFDRYNILNGTDLTPAEFEVEVGLADCTSSSIQARRIGAQELDDGFEPLNAITGSNWWAGFSWDVTESLTVQADFHHYESDNRIFVESVGNLLRQEWDCATGRQDDASVCAETAARITRSRDSLTGASIIELLNVTPFNGGFGSEREFIDARMYYTLDSAIGRFDVSVDYSFAVENYSRYDFRRRLNGQVTFSREAFSTSLSAFYRDSVSTRRCVSQFTFADRCANGTDEVSPFTSFNWTAQYVFSDATLARVRVVNVLDEEAPLDDTMLFSEAPWYNTWSYPGTGIGREVYLEAQWSF